MVAAQARWPRCVILHVSLWLFFFFFRACLGPGLFFLLFLFDSLSADVSRLKMITQALLVQISLSIRRLIGNHRDSAFRGFDV
ncbi:hypothetical protein B0H10DRAFT_2079740 [Mycena sp. CBHHK59/15]|nr:hypothetical protein B0H10DRAFT_2079740 [Mycena sp. CBHHK59/15]